MESVLCADKQPDWSAGILAAALPTFHATTTCAQAYELFHAADSQLAAAIVDDLGQVLGIANRLRFLSHYSQRFVPEIYGKRPVLALANTQPLLVDEAMPVSALAAMITMDHPDALRECFVVTRHDRYLGIGTSEALVRAKVALLMAREKQLNAALIAAENADRTRSNFLALMSHELRTPLNAIIGFSEVLASELFGPHRTPRYGEYARDIHGAGKHLLALINNILDLSKSEAGQLALHSEPLDLGLLLQGCGRLVGPRALEGKIALQVRTPADLPRLNADGLRVKQAVLNIITNAVKFTMPGGVVKAYAEVGSDGGIEIVVADNGIGMAPEMIPIALEPFRQIDSPLSRTVEGTGLGLSLAKSLTERHGGRIAIDSAPGRGTTVRLIFPPERTVTGCDDQNLRNAIGC